MLQPAEVSFLLSVDCQAFQQPIERSHSRLFESDSNRLCGRLSIHVRQSKGYNLVRSALAEKTALLSGSYSASFGRFVEDLRICI